MLFFGMRAKGLLFLFSVIYMPSRQRGKVVLIVVTRYSWHQESKEPGGPLERSYDGVAGAV